MNEKSLTNHGPGSHGQAHPATLNDDELLAACDLQFTRRSGPGGQHRNKTETAAILTHRSSGISAEASEERSQAENRRVALRRLRLKLAIELRSEPLSQPSALWQSRSRGGRLSVSSEHADFPAILCEALDALAHQQFITAQCAQQLGISSSQLVGLLKQHPPALALLNENRQAAGKPPLQ